jgi:hypothetical protein
MEHGLRYFIYVFIFQLETKISNKTIVISYISASLFLLTARFLNFMPILTKSFIFEGIFFIFILLDLNILIPVP